MAIGRLRGWTGSGSIRVGGILLALLTAGSVVGSFTLGDPLQQDLNAAYAAPGTWTHPLGTDQLGRDILSWIASGILTGLTVSAGVVALSAIVGVVIGLVAGYMGGLVEGVLMRIVDLQLAIPPLLLFIAASAVRSGGMLSLIILLSVVGWVPYARLVRSQVLADRERGYVAASRLAGSRRWRIVVVHLLPSAATQVFVFGSLQGGFALLWESALSFLGLGLQPPRVSLGFQIAAGRTYLSEAWWISTFPGIAIVLLVLSFNMLGDGLRDIFNLDIEPVER